MSRVERNGKGERFFIQSNLFYPRGGMGGLKERGGWVGDSAEGGTPLSRFWKWSWVDRSFSPIQS